ncbi:acetyltransferase [Flammeovirgaceae bacterium 311]|nr:acetyltransferase [Flammeovirgaceae bacterium 311]
MAEIMHYPQLQGLRRWMLMTVDAHSLYEQFGFSPLTKPDRTMEISNPNIYIRSTNQ